MLELHIMRYLMACESNISLSHGRVVGFKITWMVEELGIPKGTFYRAVNNLIKSGVIVRTQRGFYALGDKFRILCNRIPDGHEVKTGVE